MPLTDLTKPNGKPNMGGTLTKEYVFEIEDLEWKAYMLNRAVGLIVPDTNGNNRLVGIWSLNPDTVDLSVELPAHLTGASTSGGAARADLAGTTFTFSAPARHDALYYKGVLTLVAGA